VQAGALFTFGFASTFVSVGPHIEDEYVRYALAGTAATVGVEVLTHGFDTINM